LASGSLTDVKRVREFSRFSEIIRWSLIKTRENAPICKTLKVERLVKCMRIKAGNILLAFYAHRCGPGPLTGRLGVARLRAGSGDHLRPSPVLF